MKENLTEQDIAVLQYLLTNQLSKEFLDEVNECNLLVREFKKEANRRERWDKKFADNYILDIHKADDTTMLDLLQSYEDFIRETVKNSIEKLLEISKG